MLIALDYADSTGASYVQKKLNNKTGTAETAVPVLSPHLVVGADGEIYAVAEAVVGHVDVHRCAALVAVEENGQIRHIGHVYKRHIAGRRFGVIAVEAVLRSAEGVA